MPTPGKEEKNDSAAGSTGAGTDKETAKERRRERRATINRNCSFDYRDPQKRAKGKNGSSQIRFKTSFRNTVYDVMKKRGWKYTDSDLDWDFHWAERECELPSTPTQPLHSPARPTSPPLPSPFCTPVVGVCYHDCGCWCQPSPLTHSYPDRFRFTRDV